MDASLEKRLREMLDKQDIHDILMKYCRGIDRGDRELVENAYHPDAVDDHGDFIVAGKDIPEVLITLGHRPKNGGMHFVGNALIEVEGDAAYAESYFLSIKDFDSDGKSWLRIRAGRYVDKFERRDGRWAIAERAVADEWNRVDEIVERTGPREKYRFGTHDKDDIVYGVRRGRVARQNQSDINEVMKRRVPAPKGGK